MKKLTILAFILFLIFAFCKTTLAASPCTTEDALIALNVLDDERINLMQKKDTKVNKTECLMLFSDFSEVRMLINEAFNLPEEIDFEKSKTKGDKKVAIKVINDLLQNLNHQIAILPNDGLQINQEYETLDSSLITYRIRIKNKFIRVLKALNNS